MIHLDFSRPILTYNLQLNCVFWWRNGYGITVSCDNHNLVLFCLVLSCTVQGRIQDFKLGGGALKTLRRAEGGAKVFGVFRVKNHDFTPKSHIFFQLRRQARKFLGYFVWKITILRKQIIFFPILGGCAPVFVDIWPFQKITVKYIYCIYWILKHAKISINLGAHWWVWPRAHK